ncbi:hypothetical protein KRM28CT15_25650 [Krasilnikovia sp. M28-CT-15]
MALGLSVSALVSLVASTPMGYIADRYGPRMLQVWFYLALTALSAAMLLVTSVGGFILVASLTALADAGQRGARQATIARVIPREELVRTRAFFRSTANVGLTLGSSVAGIGLAVGTPVAYRALILGNSISYLVIAWLALRLPDIAPTPRKTSGPRLTSLRDKPFLAFVALDGMMSMHHNILSLVLPLWIAQYTDAPHWLIAVCVIVNTAMVVLFQVRMSRGTEEVAGAIRAFRSAGALIAVSCLAFASSSFGPPPLTIGLILVGAFLHVTGELRHSAAGWGLSYELASADEQGQYQATYAMGLQLGGMAAPIVLTSLVLGLGGAGWLLVAVLMLAPAAAIRPVVRWARRRTTVSVGH